MSLHALFSMLLAVANVSGAERTAETSLGMLLGNERTSPACGEFLGVPFAEAPVGELRFRDPVDWTEPYASSRAATTAGSKCLQSSGGSEDCLFLNVWQPTSANSSSKLSVMAWIHGGSFVSGAGSENDGCGLASGYDVVVASMNYRMGPFGYALFGDGGDAGNFGMKDQRSALRWLQREVSAFGGDASKVTIFGESAGGISVFYHVASPASAGLFRAAISESGGVVATIKGFSFGRQVTDDLAARIGCEAGATTRSCLQSTDAKTLLENARYDLDPFTTAGWGPTVDGPDMPDYPVKLWEQAEVNQVPLLAGTNTDEGNAFIWPKFPFGMSEAQYQSYTSGIANGHDPVGALNDTEFAELYDIYGSSDRRQAASSLVTDGTFLCSTLFVAQQHKSDFFSYRFNHRDRCLPSFILPGVYHTSEIPYIFGGHSCKITDDENALMRRMQTVWTSFAKDLKPSTDFPKYDDSARQTLVFQTPNDVLEKDYRREQCDFNQFVIIKKYLDSHGGPAVVV